MNENIRNATIDAKQSAQAMIETLVNLELTCDVYDTGRFFFGPDVLSNLLVTVEKKKPFQQNMLAKADVELQDAMAKIDGGEISGNNAERALAKHQRLVAQTEWLDHLGERARLAYQDLTGERWTMPKWAKPKAPTASEKKKAAKEQTAAAAEIAAYMKERGIGPRSTDMVHEDEARTNGVETRDGDVLRSQAGE